MLKKYIVRNASDKQLGVIVPYRDREAHLKEFIPHVENILSSQLLPFSITVVEQFNDLPFNRGLLLNAGVLENLQSDYFCFHDVDMLPIESSYSYSNCPTHLASNVEQFDWALPYEGFFGGVTLFDKKSFFKINGYSNNYWGWGSEDDDVYERCKKLGLLILRRNGTYKSLAHDRPIDNQLYQANRRRYDLARHNLLDGSADGIKQCQYEVASCERLTPYSTRLKLQFI